MKKRSFFPLCCSASLAFLSFFCSQSPFEATTDLGGDIANEIDSSIADFSKNYALATAAVTVDSAFSRRDNTPRQTGTFTVGSFNTESAYGYVEFDTVLFLGEEAHPDSPFVVRLFVEAASGESLPGASQADFPVYRCSLKDSSVPLDLQQIDGKPLFHTFVLSVDSTKKTLGSDSLQLDSVMYKVAVDTFVLRIDTSGSWSRVKRDTLSAGPVLIDSTQTTTDSDTLIADTTTTSVTAAGTDDDSVIVRRRIQTIVQTRAIDSTSLGVDTIVIDSLFKDTVSMKKVNWQSSVRISSLGLCFVPPDSPGGLFRLRKPLISIEFSNDAGKKRTRTLTATAADVSVFETDSLVRDTLPWSSWAPARHAALILNLADYWAVIDSAAGNSDSARVVNSMLKIPLKAAKNFFSESDSSVVLGYVVTSKSQRPDSDQLHRGGLRQIFTDDNTVLLNISDDIRDLYQGTRPERVTLFLQIEGARVTSSGWLNDDEWRTVMWPVKKETELKIETVFFLTD